MLLDLVSHVILAALLVYVITLLRRPRIAEPQQHNAPAIIPLSQPEISGAHVTVAQRPQSDQVAEPPRPALVGIYDRDGHCIGRRLAGHRDLEWAEQHSFEVKQCL